jgi:hypothetical protein
VFAIRQIDRMMVGSSQFRGYGQWSDAAEPEEATRTLLRTQLIVRSKGVLDLAQHTEPRTGALSMFVLILRMTY